MNKYDLIDPTMEYLQREPPTPGTSGRVTQSLGENLYQVDFRGQSHRCRGAGAGGLTAGSEVSVYLNESENWCIPIAGGYPSRYPRPLSDFNESNPAAVFLMLALKDNPKRYTYRAGIADGVVSEFVLSVKCWDGVMRSLPVRFAGADKAAARFAPGDLVLIYEPTEGNREVVANRIVTGFTGLGEHNYLDSITGPKGEDDWSFGLSITTSATWLFYTALTYPGGVDNNKWYLYDQGTGDKTITVAVPAHNPVFRILIEGMFPNPSMPITLNLIGPFDKKIAKGVSPAKIVYYVTDLPFEIL